MVLGVELSTLSCASVLMFPNDYKFVRFTLDIARDRLPDIRQYKFSVAY